MSAVESLPALVAARTNDASLPSPHLPILGVPASQSKDTCHPWAGDRESEIFLSLGHHASDLFQVEGDEGKGGRCTRIPTLGKKEGACVQLQSWSSRGGAREPAGSVLSPSVLANPLRVCKMMARPARGPREGRRARQAKRAARHVLGTRKAGVHTSPRSSPAPSSQLPTGFKFCGGSEKMKTTR